MLLKASNTIAQCLLGIGFAATHPENKQTYVNIYVHAAIVNLIYTNRDKILFKNLYKKSTLWIDG